MARKIANIYRRDDGTYQLRFTVDGKRYAVQKGVATLDLKPWQLLTLWAK